MLSVAQQHQELVVRAEQGLPTVSPGHQLLTAAAVAVVREVALVVRVALVAVEPEPEQIQLQLQAPLILVVVAAAAGSRLPAIN
jgi:hypothetical protein